MPDDHSQLKTLSCFNAKFLSIQRLQNIMWQKNKNKFEKKPNLTAQTTAITRTKTSLYFNTLLMLDVTHVQVYEICNTLKFSMNFYKIPQRKEKFIKNIS